MEFGLNSTRARQLLRWATMPEQSGQKSRGLLCPFPWGGSPSSTMWPGPRPTSVPISGILQTHTDTHTTDRLQYLNHQVDLQK